MRKASDDLFNQAVSIEIYALREQYLTLHPNEASHCPQLHAKNWYAATETDHKHGQLDFLAFKADGSRWSNMPANSNAAQARTSVYQEAVERALNTADASNMHVSRMI